MALKENTGSVSRTYLTIREGKVARKDGENWKLYDSIEGTIDELSTRENKFGEQELCINMHDGLDNYQLQLKQNGSYFRAFASMAQNITPGGRIEFIPVLKEENGRKNVGLILKQDGQIVKWAHTKSNPNGMPEPEVMTKKSGEKIYDWSERDAFLVDKVNELNARISSNVAQPVQEEQDDLPF